MNRIAQHMMSGRHCTETAEYWFALARTERIFAEHDRARRDGSIESIRTHLSNADRYEAEGKRIARMIAMPQLTDDECRKACNVCWADVGMPWPCAKNSAKRAAIAKATGAHTVPSSSDSVPLASTGSTKESS